MVATGHVRTLLHPQTNGGDGKAPGQGGAGGGRLPGLLQQGQAANVTAGSLDYQGVAGSAAYSGNAMLWQGDTTIRADAMSLDQRQAGLVAIGNARSNLPLESGVSIGRASEIRYEDATRRITFGRSPQPQAAGCGHGGGTPRGSCAAQRATGRPSGRSHRGDSGASGVPHRSSRGLHGCERSSRHACRNRRPVDLFRSGWALRHHRHRHGARDDRRGVSGDNGADGHVLPIVGTGHR